MESWDRLGQTHASGGFGARFTWTSRGPAHRVVVAAKKYIFGIPLAPTCARDSSQRNDTRSSASVVSDCVSGERNGVVKPDRSSKRMEADEGMRGVFVGTDHHMKGKPLDEVANTMRQHGFQTVAVKVRATKEGEVVRERIGDIMTVVEQIWMAAVR